MIKYGFFILICFLAVTVKGNHNYTSKYVCNDTTYNLDDVVIGESNKGAVVYTLSDFKEYKQKDCFYTLNK